MCTVSGSLLVVSAAQDNSCKIWMLENAANGPVQVGGWHFTFRLSRMQTLQDHLHFVMKGLEMTIATGTFLATASLDATIKASRGAPLV